MININSDTAQLVDSFTNAIRLMKVIGQLLRNSVNTLEGDEKKQVVESILSAAGRIMGLQIFGLRQEKDELLGYIFTRLKEKNPSMAEPEVKEEAAKRLVNLTFRTLIGLVDTVSRSVGDDCLAPTYRRVDEGDQSRKVRLFLTAIKLDWFKAFPKNGVIELYESIKRKPFAEVIVRYLSFGSLAFRRNDVGGSTLQETTSRMDIDDKRLVKRQLLTAKPTHE